MSKYRKLPVEIEAIQWNGQNVVDTYNFLEGTNYQCESDGVKTEGKNFYIRFDNGGCTLGSLIIKTLEGDMKILELEKNRLYVFFQIGEVDVSAEQAKKARRAIETVLNYIENSIPKKVVEEKMYIESNRAVASDKNPFCEKREVTWHKAKVQACEELLEEIENPR